MVLLKKETILRKTKENARLLRISELESLEKWKIAVDKSKLEHETKLKELKIYEEYYHELKKFLNK